MRLFIASDHAGFELKQKLTENLAKYFEENGIEVIDLGTDSEESCDYPIFAQKLAMAMIPENFAKADFSRNETISKANSENADKNRGILICGTGIGMSIAANRFSHIRAALCFNSEMAIMSRKHNDANVIVFGARIIDESTAENCVNLFLETEFENGRHARRINLINQFNQLA